MKSPHSTHNLFSRIRAKILRWNLSISSSLSCCVRPKNSSLLLLPQIALLRNSNPSILSMGEASSSSGRQQAGDDEVRHFRQLIYLFYLCFIIQHCSIILYDFMFICMFVCVFSLQSQKFSTRMNTFSEIVLKISVAFIALVLANHLHNSSLNRCTISTLYDQCCNLFGQGNTCVVGNMHRGELPARKWGL